MNKFNYKPDLESFLSTLKRNKSKKIPIAELGIHPYIKEKFIGRKILSIKDEIDFWSSAGYDYIKIQPDVHFVKNKEEYKRYYTLNKHSFNRSWSSEVDGIINDDIDFEKYLFPEKNTVSYKKFELAAKSLPDNFGIVGQYGDIFTLTWELMGFEKFSIALFENYDLVKKINIKLGDLIVDMIGNMLQHSDVCAIWYSDDIAFTSGLIVSPEILDDLFFPWLKKIGILTKQYDKPFIYHSDGNLFEVIDKIIECGVNVIHPIEPKAMNIKTVKNQYGDKLALIGNIDVDLLARGSKSEIIKAVIENIESVGLLGGYCVGSGNSIPEYVNYENYLTMIQTAKNFDI
jgi:uroporphyrinogen decarboxylase